jgi:hypothetical protein
MVETEFRPTSVVEVQTETTRRLRASRAAHYLLGPIRIRDIEDAGKLGGSCLLLLLAIHFRRDVTGHEAVTLPSGFLARFGIDRSAKRRGLASLEQARLIDVNRAVGHTVVIKLRAKKRFGVARK